jgi:putative spermidine/putrescine transport system permease protein
MSKAQRSDRPEDLAVTSVFRIGRRNSAPYLLLLPGITLFAAVVMVPIAMTVMLSFYEWGRYTGIEATFVLANWQEVLSDGYFHEVFLRTFRIALIVTFITAILGAPEAYILNRMRNPWKGVFLLVVLGPLFISVVARTLGWALLFGGETGIVNKLLLSVGLISNPIPFMFTETGVIIALSHVLMPFMVLAVWTSLQRLDPNLESAALSLGASQLSVLRRVMLPQVMPGILSGGVIVFALSASAFATPAIIGGRRLKMAATLAYDEFLNTLNWPLGAAVAILLLVALVAIILSCNRLVEKRYAEVFQ